MQVLLSDSRKLRLLHEMPNEYFVGHRRLNRLRMLKKASLLTNPTLAHRDAPCPKQGRSEQRGEEVRTAIVEPFAHTVNLGERDIPSSAPDIRGILLNVESLSDAKTPLADCFSILLDSRFLRRTVHRSKGRQSFF